MAKLERPQMLDDCLALDFVLSATAGEFARRSANGKDSHQGILRARSRKVQTAPPCISHRRACGESKSGG